MGSRPHLDRLLERRAEFLRFVERRVGSSATAEDLLQDALARSVTAVDDLREDAALVGWFYRVLENAIRDHHRRTGTSERIAEELQRESDSDVQHFDDAPSRTCQCVHKAKDELKPEYAHALQRIEVDEVPVKDFAAEEGISASNAAVRVFRARDALRRKVQARCGHCAALGCTDCSCVS